MMSLNFLFAVSANLLRKNTKSPLRSAHYATNKSTKNCSKIIKNHPLPSINSKSAKNATTSKSRDSSKLNKNNKNLILESLPSKERRTSSKENKKYKKKLNQKSNPYSNANSRRRSNLDIPSSENPIVPFLPSIKNQSQSQWKTSFSTLSKACPWISLIQPKNKKLNATAAIKNMIFNR